MSEWVGKEVYANVLGGIGGQVTGLLRQPGHELGVTEVSGVLKAVDERGIVVTEARAGDLFFSWAAVIMVQPYVDDEPAG